MNPLTRIPDSVRFILYLTWAVGTPVVYYLIAEEYIGKNELDLWNGIGIALGATAASNMSRRESVPVPHHSTNTEEV